MSKSLFLLLFSLIPNITQAINDPKLIEQKAGINERLNESISLETEFTDDSGRTLPLGHFFNQNKPIIIAPVYFECPKLCTLTQDGLLKSISDSDLEIGKDYTVLSVSFNHKETTKQSSARASVYRDRFPDKLKNGANSWVFLTGNQESTEKLMTEVGFKYEYDNGEFMHAAGIIILTPSGKISRYLYGIAYSTRDFKLSLLEAAQGKIGNFMNQALMFCFSYDHIQGQYTLAIWKIIRIVCTLFVLVLLGYIVRLKFNESKQI